MSLELAHAYPREAGIRSIRRTMDFGTTVKLSDTIALDKAQPVTWVLMSRPEPVQEQPGVLRLGSCVLTYPAELAFRCETIEINDARMEKCYPGKLYRMTFVSPEGTEHAAAFTVRKA